MYIFQEYNKIPKKIKKFPRIYYKSNSGIYELRILWTFLLVPCEFIKIDFYCISFLGPFEQVDILDKQGLEQVITKHRADWVIHLGALLSAIGETNVPLAIQVNIHGAHNVLNLGKLFPPTKWMTKVLSNIFFAWGGGLKSKSNEGNQREITYKTASPHLQRHYGLFDPTFTSTEWVRIGYFSKNQVKIIIYLVYHSQRSWFTIIHSKYYRGIWCKLSTQSNSRHLYTKTQHNLWSGKSSHWIDGRGRVTYSWIQYQLLYEWKGFVTLYNYLS